MVKRSKDEARKFVVVKIDTTMNDRDLVKWLRACATRRDDGGAVRFQQVEANASLATCLERIARRLNE